MYAPSLERDFRNFYLSAVLSQVPFFFYVSQPLSQVGTAVCTPLPWQRSTAFWSGIVLPADEGSKIWLRSEISLGLGENGPRETEN